MNAGRLENCLHSSPADNNAIQKSGIVSHSLTESLR